MFGEHSMITRATHSQGVRFVSVTAVFALAFGCSSNTDPNSDIQAPASLVVLSADVVPVGDTIRIQATPYSVFDVQVDAVLTWKSSATNIATIDATGLVTGVSPGPVTMTVTATAVGKSKIATQNITVIPASSASRSR